jgi:signal transduction histidine kinase
MNAGGKDRSVLQLRVTDSGCGMSPVDLNKVTAPFFTTKKNHDGLGLSMASRFIEMHGGALTIDKRASQGVDVVIVLPAALAGEPFGK